MPANEYDSLLEQPATSASDYDKLLDQPSEKQGGVLSGIGAGIWRSIPKSLGDIAGLIGAGGKSDLQGLMQTGRMISDIAHGASPEESVRKEAPDVAQQQDVLLGKYGKLEQAAGITGLAIQGAMLAAPFLPKTLRETAFGKPAPETLSEAAAGEQIQKGTIDATQERQVEKGVQPERARDDARGTPTETGVSGGVRPEAQGQEVAQPVPQPEPLGMPTGEQHQSVVDDLNLKIADAQQKVDTLKKFGITDTNLRQAEKELDTSQNELVQRTEGASDKIGAGTHVWEQGYGLRKIEIPPDAKATVKVRATIDGEQQMVSHEMNAREAHVIFTKEKSSYRALLDCLGG